MSETQGKISIEMKLIDHLSQNFEHVKAQLKETTTELERLKKPAQEAEDGFEKLKTEAGNLVKGFIAFETVKRVGAFILDCGKKANESALLQAKLTTALGYSSKALNEQSEALKRKTMYDDEQITSSQSMLANYVKSADQIEKLTPAILDLATATGQDLNTAAMQVARAIADDNGELGRYKIAVEGAKGSSERIDSVVTGLTKQFGGQAEAVAKLDSGMNRLATTWDDLQKQIGRGTNEALKPSAKFMADVLDSFIEKDKINLAKESITEIEGILKRLKAIQSAGYGDALNQKSIQSYESKIKQLQDQINAERNKVTRGDLNNLLAANDRQQNIYNPKSEKSSKSAQSDTSGAAIAEIMAMQEDGVKKFQEASDKRQQAAWRNHKLELEMLNAECDASDKASDIKIKNELAIQKASDDAARKKEMQDRAAMASAINVATNFAATLDIMARAAGVNGEKMKSIKLAEVWINAAAGIMSMWSQAGSLGPIAGPIIAGIDTALILATAGAQSALISKQKFATGGYGSGMALVGERGPEMVNLGSGSRIYNNHETKNMYNQGTTFNIQVGKDTVETLRTSLRTGDGRLLLQDIKKAMS